MTKPAPVFVTGFGLVDRPDDGGYGTTSGPPDEDEIQVCLAWLARYAKPIRKFNFERSSYGLKHDVERWTDTLPCGHTYVSNGAFIVAAERAGFERQRLGHRSPNCAFNFSVRKKPLEPAVSDPSTTIGPL